jgi:hypothetical protein
MKQYWRHIRNIVRLSEKYPIPIKIKTLILNPDKNVFWLNKKQLLWCLKILKYNYK